MGEFRDFIFRHIVKLDKWISKNNWKGYDPFDGLNAKVLNWLTFDNHYLRIILQQSIRRFPVNLRPLVGIKKETGSKGMGFCALGYLKLYQTTSERDYIEKIKFCLEWLKNNYSKGYSGCCWGNHFSYESRGGTIPLNVPTIVWTSLIANAFLDAFEALGENSYFDIARSACNFIINDIGQHHDSYGNLCFMYTPQNKNVPSLDGCIHNANVLGAWLLARIYKHTKEEKFFSLAKRAVGFTAKYQTPDGGWYYGVTNKYRWIDSFHTAYVLESLYGYIKATEDDSYEENLIRGFHYFKSAFFIEDGTPKYYNNKTYPIDIQCASQGIQTLVKLREFDDFSLEIAKKLAKWTICNMQSPKGYFYFRKYPMIISKTPMFHWGQATMLSALGHLLQNI